MYRSSEIKKKIWEPLLSQWTLCCLWKIHISFLEYNLQSTGLKYMGCFHFCKRYFHIKFIYASFTMLVSDKSAHTHISKLTPKCFSLLSHIYFLIRLEIFQGQCQSFILLLSTVLLQYITGIKCVLPLYQCLTATFRIVCYFWREVKKYITKTSRQKKVLNHSEDSNGTMNSSSTNSYNYQNMVSTTMTFLSNSWGHLRRGWITKDFHDPIQPSRSKMLILFILNPSIK